MSASSLRLAVAALMALMALGLGAAIAWKAHEGRCQESIFVIRNSALAGEGAAINCANGAHGVVPMYASQLGIDTTVVKCECSIW